MRGGGTPSQGEIYALAGYINPLTISCLICKMRIATVSTAQGFWALDETMHQKCSAQWFFWLPWSRMVSSIFIVSESVIIYKAFPLLFSWDYTKETKDHYFYCTDKETMPNNWSRVNRAIFSKAWLRIKSLKAYSLLLSLKCICCGRKCVCLFLILSLTGKGVFPVAKHWAEEIGESYFSWQTISIHGAPRECKPFCTRKVCFSLLS